MRIGSKLTAVAVCVMDCVVAFPVGPSATRRVPVTRTSYQTSSLTMVGGGNDPLANGELTSALARLDRQWKLRQVAKGGKSRWTKLILRDNDDKSDDATEQRYDTTIDDPFQDPVRSKTIPTQDFVYLLEPESSIPSCLIVFCGGAGLGQFPHIAYSEFLMRVSNKLNAAILTAPYQVGLNHFDIAKLTGERLRKALIQCQDDPARQYPASLPTYALAHSLGAKLMTIYMAATGQEYDGIGFLSYNNFSFSQTVTMARSFAQRLREGNNENTNANTMGQSGATEALNGIFDLAESAIGALGFDFSPTPSDMDRLVQLKYTPDLQEKTRLFVFDDDNLDSSASFLGSCSTINETSMAVSGLPGTHLTPVYFKFGLDDFPEEARTMAADAVGGIQSASFGNEEELDAVVDEVCGWILGKGPSRDPSWNGEAGQRETRFRLSPEVPGSRQ